MTGNRLQNVDRPACRSGTGIRLADFRRGKSRRGTGATKNDAISL